MKKVFLALLALALSPSIGCRDTGVRVVASSATYTNVGDVNWDEYKIPVVSFYIGPKATVWVNKDYVSIDEVEVYGSVTNNTAALAIYNSVEQKALSMRLRFCDRGSTNSVVRTK